MRYAIGNCGYASNHQSRVCDVAPFDVAKDLYNFVLPTPIAVRDIGTDERVQPVLVHLQCVASQLLDAGRQQVSEKRVRQEWCACRLETPNVFCKRIKAGSLPQNCSSFVFQRFREVEECDQRGVRVNVEQYASRISVSGWRVNVTVADKRFREPFACRVGIASGSTCDTMPPARRNVCRAQSHKVSGQLGSL